MWKILNSIKWAWDAITEIKDAATSRIKSKIAKNKLAWQYSKDIPSTFYTEWRNKAMDEVKQNIKSWDNISARKRVLEQLDRIEKQAIKDNKPTSAEYVKPAQKKYEKLLKWHWINSMKF